MTSNYDNSNNRYGFRFGLRSLFVVMTVLAVFFACYGWLNRRFWEPRRQSEAVARQIEALAKRRPNDMSQQQWESAVAWTLNLHHNSLIMFQADGPKIRAFNERLAKKLTGEVNLDTIHWIWDEYAKECPGGANYQRFRAHMDDEIKRGGVSWGLNVR